MESGAPRWGPIAQRQSARLISVRAVVRVYLGPDREKRDSNPYPMVLETIVLPLELFSLALRPPSGGPRSGLSGPLSDRRPLDRPRSARVPFV